MIDDKTGSAQPRRIHPVTKALKPVQDCIGQLNEAAAFLAAYAQRNPDPAALAKEVAHKRERLAETLVMFDTINSHLPEKYRRDTRLGDAHAAIDRLTRALDAIEAASPAPATGAD